MTKEENSELEERIRSLAAYEERLMVKHALSEVSWRYWDRSRVWNEAKEEAVTMERNRCLAICAQFPDNRMAQHIATLIRGDRSPDPTAPTPR